MYIYIYICIYISQNRLKVQRTLSHQVAQAGVRVNPNLIPQTPQG